VAHKSEGNEIPKASFSWNGREFVGALLGPIHTVMRSGSNFHSWLVISRLLNNDKLLNPRLLLARLGQDLRY